MKKYMSMLLLMKDRNTLFFVILCIIAYIYLRRLSAQRHTFEAYTVERMTAALSALAYTYGSYLNNQASKSQIDVKLGELGLTLDDKNSSSDALVAYNNSNVYIAYRGSDFENASGHMWYDIGSDLSIFLAGNAWNVRTYTVGIPTYLNVSLSHPNKNIYLTGHSLGGAVALTVGKTYQNDDRLVRIDTYNAGSSIWESIGATKDSFDCWKGFGWFPTAKICDKLHEHVMSGDVVSLFRHFGPTSEREGGGQPWNAHALDNFDQ